jgi:hypothetical protein
MYSGRGEREPATHPVVRFDGDDLVPESVHHPAQDPGARCKVDDPLRPYFSFARFFLVRSLRGARRSTLVRLITFSTLV